MTATEVREYHDDTRTVTIRDADGIATERPYTVAENAEADARAAKVSNETVVTTDARTTINTLLTSITTIQTIIDKTNATIGPADTKDLARELKTIARQVVRLSRLQLNVLDSTNVGT